jgi:predicted acylesterase/phospholipase RssA
MSLVPQPELVFVTQAAWCIDPPELERLTHLLAGAVAFDTQCQTVIVFGRGGALEILEWQANAFVPVFPLLVNPPRAPDLRGLIHNVLGTARGRVFIANLDAPQARPAAIDHGVQFDRLVYVTDGIPEAIPGAFAGFLTNSASGFSTFIPSVLVPPKPARSPFRAPLPFAPKTPFGVREVPDRTTFVGAAATVVANRLFRDACHITVDGQALADAFPPPAGMALVDHVTPALRRRAMRWARAVTNRRVGVAVSGGGASAYRVKAFLDELSNAGVPVDVLAGLSGGALVGAYYCEGGTQGLERAVETGPFFQAALPIVLFTSWPLEFLIDVLLGQTRVDETDVRYAALAVELSRFGPPESIVVKEGTLGEAVRTSGCLPPAFAPTHKNRRRYTDGGAAAVVPARLVRDCGADVTIAVNAIPGIRTSNPLDFLPLGWFLHDWTPLGRLLNIFAWYTFMWTRISRRSADEANVFLEFSPQRIPFVECLCWWDARGIADRARNEPQLAAAVADAAAAWAGLPKC